MTYYRKRAFPKIDSSQRKLSKVKLEHGKVYRAELVLPWYVGETTAKNRLTEAGFEDVQTYKLNGKTYAQGRWMGPSEDVELPSQVRNPIEVGSA